jgi:hypothetical protein
MDDARASMSSAALLGTEMHSSGAVGSHGTLTLTDGVGYEMLPVNAVYAGSGSVAPLSICRFDVVYWPIGATARPIRPAHAASDPAHCPISPPQRPIGPAQRAIGMAALVGERGTSPDRGRSSAGER